MHYIWFVVSTLRRATLYTDYLSVSSQAFENDIIASMHKRRHRKASTSAE